jgi:predicted regulator of Ras-like GTPase activity (Roadblock/LC7/MglB family)
MFARSIDPAFVAACQHRLKELAINCPGLKAASISTKDGVVIASYGASEENTKIAVIAGTLHAVGEAVVSEADLQDCRNIVIEAGGGRVALLSLPGTLRDFVLSAIVGTNTSLGMLLGCCRVCCESIAFAEK